MKSDAVTSSFADVFMLQSVLWAPTLPNVVWSLAYEMVFYLLLTALFLGGVHRRSNRYALVFAVGAVALGGVLHPGSLSHHLLTPGVVVAITDSLVLVGLVMALAGRGRARTAGAALAAATGLLVIIFNSGYAAPWESFAIFALMFTGTLLYRAEAGEYPWRRAVYVVILVFGFALVAVQWHTSPLLESFVAIRKTFNSLEFAGLTFAVAMLCRHRKVRAPSPGSGWSATRCTCFTPRLSRCTPACRGRGRRTSCRWNCCLSRCSSRSCWCAAGSPTGSSRHPCSGWAGGSRAGSTPGSDRTCSGRGGRASRRTASSRVRRPASRSGADSRASVEHPPGRTALLATLGDRYRSYTSNHERLVPALW